MDKEILSRLYEIAKELPVTDEYIRYKEEFAKERDKFLKIIGEQHRQELENLTDIISNMDNELCKQDFCEGFSIAVRLFIESTYKEERDV